MEDKILTFEQAEEFLAKHMEQKELYKEEFEATLKSYGDKKDCFFVGFFEGLLNGFTLAGGKLGKDFQDETENPEVSPESFEQHD